MLSTIIGFLTLIFFPHGLDVQAEVLQQKEFKNHLRWSITAKKGELLIIKKNMDILIKSLDEKTLDKLSSDFKKNLNKKYFKSGNTKIKKDKGNFVLSVPLKNKNIEIFKFYQYNEKRQIVDFWVNIPEKNKKKTSILKKKTNKKSSVAKKKISLKKRNEKSNKKKEKYRDFRYGASFIWDYSPVSPEIKRIINLKSKTPDYFYSIKDRKYKKSDEETHLQLIVNFYRKKKWSFMYKSIELFEKKYKDSDLMDFIEYMKINAILKDHLVKGKDQKSSFKVAMDMLSGLSERTQIYELRKGSLKYLLQFYLDNKGYVKALDIAKKLFTISRKKHDRNEAQYAAEAILYNLAHLGRNDKMKNLVDDQDIKLLIPKQKLLAYQIYALMEMDEEEKVIKIFEKNKKGFMGSIHESILFNIAEAYFRNAHYQEAIKYFDKYIISHKGSKHSSKARLRLALSYELTEKDIKKTIDLYKTAINRSLKDETGYEARIRYVSLISVRKKDQTKQDKELRILLKRDNENEKLGKNIKKLLWLVRLRIFIVDGKFEKALTYLEAIPFKSLKYYEQNVFIGDGAEIIYGILQQYYNQGKYAKVMEVWNRYQEKYVNKVASDPYINLIIGKSCLKLKLYESMEKILASFEKIDHTPSKTYPLWNDRNLQLDSKIVVMELKIMRHMELENWKLAYKQVDLLANRYKKHNRINYFKGMISYKKEKYKETVDYLEKFLSDSSAKFDDIEMADLLMAYTDSIYQMKEIKKFKRTAAIVLRDVNKRAQKNTYLDKVKERISYLNIEIMHGEDGEKLILEDRIRNFKMIYKKSIYSGRINYILGMTLLANKKMDDGKKVFLDLIKDEKTPEHIKQLAKSELSLIKIKEKTI